MNHDSYNAYLETQIATATPQKLRLMLIEGASCFARATLDAWERSDHAGGLESLIRCRDVIGELIAGIQGDSSPLAQQVLSVYLFLFTTLTEAQLTHDEQELAAAIRVLDEERETWRAVCEKHPDRIEPVEEPREVLAPAIVARGAMPGSEGLCLEA